MIHILVNGIKDLVGLTSIVLMILSIIASVFFLLNQEWLLGITCSVGYFLFYAIQDYIVNERL